MRALLPWLAVLVAACGAVSSPSLPRSPPAPRPAVSTAGSSTLLGPAVTAGVDETAIDTSVDPCHDFYAHACGAWMKRTPIPEDHADWMRSFDGIFEHNELVLRQILEKEGSGGKAGTFYTACMDETAVEAAGSKPLEPWLARIEAVADPATLARLLAAMHAAGFAPLFTFGAGQDFKDASQIIAVAEQGGLGLPDRDDYVKDDARAKETRAAYGVHVAAMLALAGDPAERASAGSRAVLEIETALARASMTNVERRDPQKVYHRVDRAGLERLAPDLAWGAYLQELGFPDIGALNVAEPEFFRALGALLRRSRSGAALLDLKAYLRWHLVNGAASQLAARFVEQDLKLRSRITGATALPPRWKRCVRATDVALGDALGEPFGKLTLGSEGKADAESILASIERAMRRELDHLPWMDEPTRGRAREKLGLLGKKVAYPDVWRRYDELHVERTAHFDNTRHAASFETRRQLLRIGRPLDRSEWQMTPSTVNAYYDASLNELAFPAGILQPPLYARTAGAAANYGAIGMVMGHELTHGFDDEGRQFDGRGNLKSWSTPGADREFDRRAACVTEQFDGYVAIDDLHVNGRLTLGENLADLGGLKLAYKAFKAASAAGAPAARFSPAAQFFLGFAQSWCGKLRPEALRLMVTTKPHAPPRFRVNGPLSNMPEFAEAFSCKEGTAMARIQEKRCDIW